MTALRYAKPERLSLRDHPEFREVWLHDRICEDPSVLGLGDVSVLAREKAQPLAGRLDLLLWDEEDNRRYEVEIMLGPTDPSHIMRCIEYWDIERRRYPAYEHVAVIVAEDITSRFLNLMALLSGSIPLIAVQLSALRVGDQVVLHFSKVLDQATLREDDTVEATGGEVNRAYWENRVGTKLLGICDRVVEIANEKLSPMADLLYLKHKVAITVDKTKCNALYFYPKKSFVHVAAAVSNAQEWLAKFEKAGIEARSRKSGAVVSLLLTPGELAQQEELIRGLVHQAVAEHNE